MEEKEKEIIQRAQHLFFTYGIKSITLDEIATKLGISKKTLYTYFKNKADLVKRTLENNINCLKEETCSIKAESNNAIEEIIEIFRHTHTHVSEMNPGVLYDLQKYYPESWNVFVKYKNEFIYNEVLNNLKRGVQEGLFREDMNLEIIAKLYVARIDIIFNTEIFPPVKYSFKDIFRELFIYHLNGIGSEKGKSILKKLELNL